MTERHQPITSLLYIAPSEDLVLLDIPESIAEVHGFREKSTANNNSASTRSGGLRLLSKRPLDAPYPSAEPKTEAARRKIVDQVQADSSAVVLGGNYQELLRDALTILRGCYAGDWCLAREVVGDACVLGRRRDLRRRRGGALDSSSLGVGKVRSAGPAVLRTEDAASTDDSLLSVETAEEAGSPGSARECESITEGNEEQASVSDDIATLFSGMINRPSNSMRFLYYMEPMDASTGTDMLQQMKDQCFPSRDAPDLIPDVLHNPLPWTIKVVLIDSASDESQRNTAESEATFYLPPDSTILLSQVDRPLTLRTAIRETFTSPRQNFNFILLDPPWPNRSAKRSTPYASSNSRTYLGDLKRMLIATDLETYLAPGGYMGVWITNKPAVRETVLGAKGLFAKWNVQLAEEWVYLKTTVDGQPVTALDGIWRKPYEVLLLGRAPVDSMRLVDPVETDACGLAAVAKRRAIVAVPDLHSRKPCLKGLVERWLELRPGHYEALEMFGRYAAEGWWTWGNEALKFSHVDAWVDAEEG